jgi:hypothetical protein
MSARDIFAAVVMNPSGVGIGASAFRGGGGADPDGVNGTDGVTLGIARTVFIGGGGGLDGGLAGGRAGFDPIAARGGVVAAGPGDGVSVRTGAFAAIGLSGHGGAGPVMDFGGEPEPEDGGMEPGGMEPGGEGGREDGDAGGRDEDDDGSGMGGLELADLCGRCVPCGGVTWRGGPAGAGLTPFSSESAMVR